jgi:hypothetical protein
MSRTLQIVLSIAILAIASLQAPFAHLHPGDPDDHHAAGFIHTHLAVADHHGSAPEIGAHDDDDTAINVDWAPTAAPRVTVIYATSISLTHTRPTTVQLGTAPEFAPRANSPPRRLRLPARAPPV